MDVILDKKYKVIKKLGGGNASRVMLVENIRLGNKFAVKSVSKDNKINDLLKEGKLLISLEHPGLPKVIDIFEENGDTFLVEEYIEGTTLEEIVKNNGCMNWKSVAEMMIKLCDTLTYLHEKQPKPIIHKDIKPANIMLQDSGRLVLLDFGITKIDDINKNTEDTCIVGTPFYAAPEQCDGRGATLRSDIFSLGITMFYLLKGIVPDGIFISRKISNLEKDIPNAFMKLLNSCVEWEQDKRPATVRVLKDGLSDIITPKGFLHSIKKGINFKKNIVPQDYKKTIILTGAISAGVTTIATALSEKFKSNGIENCIIELRKNKKIAVAFENVDKKEYLSTDSICSKEYEMRDKNQSEILKYSPEKLRDIYILHNQAIENDKNLHKIIADCRQEYGVTIICADIENTEKLINYADKLFVIKDLDLNNLEEYKLLLLKLTSNNNLSSKITLIINKYLTSKIKQSDIVTAMTINKIPFYTIQFEFENLRNAIECFASSYFNCKKFTPIFKNCIASIAEDIYPLGMAKL